MSASAVGMSEEGGRFAAPPGLIRYQSLSLIVGVAALALTAVGVLLTQDYKEFFFAYLTAYVFWAGISVGCLALLMLQFVARGAWGVIIRRVAEAGTKTLPLAALLFVPVIAGMGHLYSWTHHEVTAHDELLQSKSIYLNTGTFIVRACIYFGTWLIFAYLLNRWSREQDRGPGLRLNNLMRNLSGPGIVAYALTVTIAATDWVMSLDPHWYSSIFGILFMGGWGLSALAFIIVTLALLARTEPFGGILTPTHFHDLGKLLLALLMLYTYFHLSQLEIIWSANLPEETPWYLRRISGGWRYLAIGLFLLEFAIPFLVLLTRRSKRDARVLGALAALILVMRLVDAFYLVAPEAGGHAEGPALAPHAPWPAITHLLLYPLAAVGIGGLWLTIFIRKLRQLPLLPAGDPLLERALEHGRHEHH